MATSFATDIQPIFKPYRANMLWRFDLMDYDLVKANAAAIQAYIFAGESSRMPPANYGSALTAEQLALFKQWMSEGCPP